MLKWRSDFSIITLVRHTDCYIPTEEGFYRKKGWRTMSGKFDGIVVEGAIFCSKVLLLHWLGGPREGGTLSDI